MNINISQMVWWLCLATVRIQVFGLLACIYGVIFSCERDNLACVFKVNLPTFYILEISNAISDYNVTKMYFTLKEWHQ